MKKLLYILSILVGITGVSQNIQTITSESAGSFEIMSEDSIPEEPVVENEYIPENGGNVVGLFIEEGSDARIADSTHVCPLRWSIYPNPGNGIYHLTSYNKPIKEIIVRSLPGTIIKSVSVKDQFKSDLSLSGFTPGLYLLEIICTDSSTETEKIVLQ